MLAIPCEAVNVPRGRDAGHRVERGEVEHQHHAADVLTNRRPRCSVEAHDLARESVDEALPKHAPRPVALDQPARYGVRRVNTAASTVPAARSTLRSYRTSMPCGR